MPTIITEKAYAFAELNEQAKEKARDWWRSCEDADFDTEFVVDDAERMGALLGITFDSHYVPLMNGGKRPRPTVYWSGFSSQGDGACFEGRYTYAKGAAKAIAKKTGGSEPTLISIAERLQAMQRKHSYALKASTAHSGHYYHSGCMSVSVTNNRHAYGDASNEAEEALTDCLRDFANWIYRQLEAEYTYLMSDENVDESIEANEYLFDENGAIA